MGKNTSVEESYHEIAENVGNTFRDGIQGAAVLNYAQGRSQQTQRQKVVTQSTPEEQNNKQATAANGGNTEAASANGNAPITFDYENKTYEVKQLLHIVALKMRQLKLNGMQ